MQTFVAVVGVMMTRTVRLSGENAIDVEAELRKELVEDGRWNLNGFDVSEACVKVMQVEGVPIEQVSAVA